MNEFRSQANEIQSHGSLLFIAAQKRNAAVRMPNGDPVGFLTKHPIPFPFLLDEDRSVTRSYGVYTAFNHESIRIAVPSTFVIGRDQKIRYIYVGANQNDRAPLAEVMAHFHNAAQ